VVDGVGHHDVVPHPSADLVGQQDQSLRLAEPGGRRVAVEQAALAAPDRAKHPLAVRRELDQPVVAGVGGEQRAVRETDRLGGEAQLGVRRWRRDVRPVAAAQRALRVVLLHEVGDERVQGPGVALPGHLRDDVPLGVHDDEGRPGPGGVGLPRDQLRVVEDRVVHLVALDGRSQRLGVGLVGELRRVHPDGDQDVGVLLLERTQLVQHVQAVDAAERPEVQQDDASPQVRQAEVGAAGVEPGPAAQLRRPNAHAPSGPDRHRVSVQCSPCRTETTPA
jgi:hypothetical protein